MSSIKYVSKSLNNIQIYSALLWAAAILLCSNFQDSSYTSTILITLAGFHVVLMSVGDRLKTVKSNNG